MPNFLTLCNAVWSDSATASGTTPLDTVLNQTGRPGKIVEITARAYLLIQNHHRDWRWMTGEFVGATVAATQRYTGTSFLDADSMAAITRFREFITTGDSRDMNMQIYDPSIGLADKGRLTFMEWPLFRQERINSTHTSSKPTHFSIDNQGRLCLSPIPDKVYNLLGIYRKSAQTLADDGDEPEMPEDFQIPVIVPTAVQLLELMDEAPISQQQLRNILGKNKSYSELRQVQLPTVRFGGPLA